MKPIAVVHWEERGVPKSKECFDQERLNRIARTLKECNYVFIICLCVGSAVVPFSKSRSNLRAI